MYSTSTRCSKNYPKQATLLTFSISHKESRDASSKKTSISIIEYYAMIGLLFLCVISVTLIYDKIKLNFSDTTRIHLSASISCPISKVFDWLKLLSNLQALSSFFLVC